MATKTSINSYVKNVVKSAGYITVESLKSSNPVISDFVETNSDAVKELYQSARDYKKILRSGKESIANNDYMKIAKETAQNFLDDLKTGKFYNPEREKETDKALFEGFGMMDFDFDDDTNWDDDDDDSLTTSSMDKIGQKMAQSTGKAAIASADYIVKSSRADSKANRAHNDILFGRLNNGLAAINSTISSIGKNLIPSAATHFSNSSKFYEVMTQETAKQTVYLEKIYKILEDRFEPKQQSYSRKSNPWRDIFGDGGSLNLKEYAKYAKDNILDSFSMLTTMADMINGMDELGGKGSTLRKALSSPVALIMQLSLGGMLETGRSGKAFKRLNDAIAGAFSSIPGFISRKAKNGGMVWDFLEDILGIRKSSKRRIDTSKYEKGRVDWTGKDAKALREVIPTQLALILSALTGNEAKVYDYESGKWKTYSSIQDDHRNRIKRIAYDSQRDMVDLLNKEFSDEFKEKSANSKNISASRSKAYKTWTDDLMSFYNYIQKIGIDIPVRDEDWKNLKNRMKAAKLLAKNSSDSGLILEKNFDRIEKYYKKLFNDKKIGYGKFAASNANLKMSSSFGRASYLEGEERNETITTMLYNGSGLGLTQSPTKVNLLTNAIDNKGNNIFFYLQHYYIKMSEIASYLNGGRRFQTKRNKVQPQVDIIPENIGNLNRARENRTRSSQNKRWDMDDDGGDSAYDPNEDIKTDWAEKYATEFKDKAKENKFIRKIDNIVRSLGNLFGKPMDGFESIIDSVDRNIYEFFYGKINDNNKNHKSFITQFYSGMRGMFDSLETQVKSLFRDKINPVIGAFADKISNLFGFDNFGKLKEGVKNSKFVKNTIGELKSAGSFVKESVKSTFGEVRDFLTGFRRNKAARGGYVTKSGMVSVSEGEIILPNKNPFANPYKMDRTEKRNATNYLASGGMDFWGNFKKGGRATKIASAIAKEFGKEGKRKFENFSREQKIKFDKFMASGSTAAEAFQKVMDMKDNINQNIDDIASAGSDEDIVNEAKKKAKSAKEKAREWIDPLVDGVLNNVSSVFHRLFGDLGDKDGNKKIKANMKDIFADMKKSAPGIAAGGIIGGVLSSVGGLVGGPLLGAAIGAAIGYTKKSEKMQKFLFGEQEGEDGYGNKKYKGGLFGPKLSGFINNMLPDLSKFGITGGIGGLLGVVPGGPIAGMAIGAGLGLLVKSDSVRNYLFGEEGLFGKDGDKKIKKALPKMGLGAAALAFTGPFGLAGNILLGSAIGFATQTDKFKEFIFGVEDENGELQGGILGSIRKRIVDPLKDRFYGGLAKGEKYLIDNLFKPLGNLVKPVNDAIKGIFNSVADHIKGTINTIVVQPLANAIDRWVIKPFSKVTGFIGNSILKLTKGAINITGGAATLLGRGRTRTNIRKGIATSMTRQERQAWQSDPNVGENYKFASYDKNSASMNAEELQKHYENLKSYRNLVNKNKNDMKDNNQKIMNQLMADTEMDSSFWSNKKLSKMLSNGDFNGAEEWILDQASNGNMHGKTEAALKSLSKARENYEKLASNKFGEQYESAKESMKALGIDDSFLFGKDSRKFFRLMDSDIYHDKKGNIKSEDEINKIKDDASDRILTPVNVIKNVLYQIRNGIYKMNGDQLPDDEGSKVENEQNSNNSVSNAVNAQSGNLNNDAPIGSIQSVATENGIIQYVQTKDGLEPNLRNSETKETIEKKKKDDSLKSKFFTKMDSFFGFFGTLFGKKEEKKEETKKEGIFSKIGRGISGLLGGAGKLLGGLFSGTGSSFLGLGAAAVGAAGVGIGAEWLLDNFPALKAKAVEVKDKIVNWIETDGIPMLGDAFSYVSHKLGDVLIGLVSTFPRSIDEIVGLISRTKGRYDKVQDAIQGRDPSKYDENEFQREYMTDQYGKTLLKKSIILGQTGNKALEKIPVIGKIANAGLKYTGKIRNTVVDNASKMLKNTKISNFVSAQKAFSEAYQSFTKAGIGNAAEMAAETVGTSLSSKSTQANVMFMKLIDALQQLISKLITKLGGKVGSEAAEKVISEGAEKIASAAAKVSSSKLGSSLLKTVGGPIGIAFGVWAFSDGIQSAKAKEILGIVTTPTIGERLLAATVHAINEMIPGIGGLIDSGFILSIIINILRLFGFTWVDDLLQKREEARNTVNSYNKENDETYTIEEYVHNVQNDYTINQRIVGGVKSVFKPVGKVASAIKGGFTSAKNTIQEKGLFGAIGTGISGAVKGVEWVGKGAAGITSKIGDGIYDFFKGIGAGTMNIASLIADAGKSIIKMQNDMYSKFSDPNVSFGEMFSTKIELDDNNPFKPIASNIAAIVKVPTVAAIVIEKLGRGIKKKYIDPFVDDLKVAANDVASNAKDVTTFIKNGDITGLFTDTTNISPENPYGFISTGSDLIMKTFAIVPTAISWTGHKVMNVIDTIKDGAITGFSVIKTEVDAAVQCMKDGDMEGLMNLDPSGNTNESFGFLIKPTIFASQVLLGIPTSIVSVGNTLSNLFNSGKNKFADMKSLINDLWDSMSDENADMKNIINSYKSNGEGPVAKVSDAITTVVGGIMKMVIGFVKPFMWIGNKVGEGLEWVGNKKDQAIAWAGEKVDQVSDNINNALTSGKNWINSFSGKGSHVSQYDSKYAKRRFGNYTIAEQGCGPAVATSVLRRYGKDQSFGDSINYAEVNGYVAGASGTKAGYFSDIFNANGIRSSYTTNQNQMRKNIKAGKPTVLLGQDDENDSKFRSPFGPSPHYVVAQGMDKKGNVIIDDPELGSTALYKNKILNKAKLGVLTGGDSGINNDIDDMKASMRNKGLVNGKTADGNSTEAKVYQFFTQNGFTPASTAGIMGNIYQESKFDPAALQNGRGPAAGLFQWDGYTTNGGRWIELNKYAQSKGKHWTDLQSQLEYALKEMAETQKWMWTSGPANNKYASVSGLDEFKQMKDPSMATEAFENHFERAGTPMMDTRKQKAIEYYNKYSGATFTNPTTFGSTDFSNNNSSSDSSSGGLDLGSIIGNFISGTLGKVFGAMGKFGEFLSGAFGITNSDNQTLSNGVSLNGGSLSSGSNILGSTGSVVSTTANKFPYYNQGDGQWANIQYGKSGTMKTSACGPTSMAMVLQSYGKHYTPVDAANYSVQKGHRVENQGTAWTFFKDIGNANGLDVNQFESVNTAKQYLNQGIPVIGSMKPGDFTKSGHFIVFTGLDGNKLYVNDPASTERTGKIWNADNSLAQAKQFWSVSQNGQGSLGIKPGVNEFSAGNSGLPDERLKVIDFTKIYGGSSDVSSTAVQNTAMKADINDARKKNINANAFGSSASTEITKAVKSGDLSQMIQVAIEYLKTIASNTAYNASLAQIVQLMTQLTQIVAATQSGSTNSSDDNMVLRTQTEDILNKLNALATAV